MAIERLWVSVPTQVLTSDGGRYGEVSIPTTVGIKVKHKVRLGSNTQPEITLEVKRVINSTDILLGPIGPEMRKYSDLRLYLTSANSYLIIDEQERNKIVPDAFWRAVYEEEPTVALRTFLVDYLGNRYSDSNPIPVAGSLSISTSETLVPKILNYTITDANTNVNIPIPANVRKFSIKLRDGKGPLRIYDSLNGPFYTVSKGSDYNVDGITTPVTSLLVQSSQGDSIVEIYAWVKT